MPRKWRFNGTLPENPAFEDEKKRIPCPEGSPRLVEFRRGGVYTILDTIKIQRLHKFEPETCMSPDTPNARISFGASRYLIGLYPASPNFWEESE